MGPNPLAKDISSCKSRTIAPIFTYKTSFYPESKVVFIKIKKSRKILSVWGLGLRNYIWTTWAQKTYLAITPEPYHQFLHTRPHFIQNQKLLSLKLWNLEKFCQFGVWGLETAFEPPQKMYLSITPKPYHQFLHTRPHFIHNQKFKLWNLEKSCQFGVWDLETTFGSLGPKKYI